MGWSQNSPVLKRFRNWQLLVLVRHGLGLVCHGLGLVPANPFKDSQF